MSSSPDSGGGRSSTASHFSKNYETVSAGVAADDFYGIPLWNDVGSVPLDDLMPLILLLVILLLKPRIQVLSDPDWSFVFWVFVFVAAYQIKELTLYPLISTIIFTRTSYPYLIVIPHCILATAAYRKDRASDTNNSSQEERLHYIPSFGLGFFCHGFGGSIVSDVLMGLPATALGHERIVPCWILGWILVWFSPGDFVYTTIYDKSSFFHYFFSACEAIDTVTTPMGRISRGARELANKRMAPIMGGIFAGCGGAVIRYAERVIHRKRGEDVAKASFQALESGVWRTLGYSVLWWYIAIYKCVEGEYDDPGEYHCHEFNGNNMHRFLIVITFVMWNFACDIGINVEHPFNTLSKILLSFGDGIASGFGLGPQPALPVEDANRDEKDKED